MAELRELRAVMKPESEEVFTGLRRTEALRQSLEDELRAADAKNKSLQVKIISNPFLTS